LLSCPLRIPDEEIYLNSAIVIYSTPLESLNLTAMKNIHILIKVNENKYGRTLYFIILLK
jgi:hypothetical protein